MVAIVLFGCGGRVVITPGADAGDDVVADSALDSAPPETAVSDAPAEVADAPLDVPPPPGCAPIVGTTAFGVVLSGAVTLDDGSKPGPLSAYAYFPGGRVAGAPVILAMADSLGWSTARATLDASLGAKGLRVEDPYCHESIDATLIGPNDGFVARVELNPSDSDAIILHPGNARLCSTGPVPALALITPPKAELLEPFVLFMNAPLDPTTYPALTASQPVTTGDDRARLRIGPASAAFGLDTKLTLSLGGVRDVLGRPLPDVAVDLPVPFGRLAGSASEITFAEGGLGATPKVETGVLSVTLGWSHPWPPNYPRYGIGLPDAAGATKLRLRHRSICVTTGPANVRVIGATGKTTTIVAKCASTPSEETIPLPPSDGRYVLLIDYPMPTSLPCNYPAPTTSVTYQLAGFRYDP